MKRKKGRGAPGNDNEATPCRTTIAVPCFIIPLSPWYDQLIRASSSLFARILPAEARFSPTACFFAVRDARFDSPLSALLSSVEDGADGGTRRRDCHLSSSDGISKLIYARPIYITFGVIQYPAVGA